VFCDLSEENKFLLDIEISIAQSNIVNQESIKYGGEITIFGME
jgi:hypothetical protein